MPVAQSPAHYINSSKGCPSITESFPLCFLLVLCATVAALPVVEPHYETTIRWESQFYLGLVNQLFVLKCTIAEPEPFYLCTVVCL
jgi:hypothetical protein